MQLGTTATQSLAQPEEIPRPSRSTYFGDVSETIGRTKTRSEHVNQNAQIARNNEAYGLGKFITLLLCACSIDVVDNRQRASTR